MTNISHNSIVLHFWHHISRNNTFISCCTDKNIHFFKNIIDSNHLKSLHTCLKSTDWVNLSNIDSCTCTFHGLSTTFSNITKTCNNNFFSWNHNISCSVDSINEWMFTSIDIIKLGFCNRVIDINARENNFFILHQFVKSSNSSCSFFRDSS